VSLSISSRTCEEVERSKLNKEILFHVKIFVIIIEVLIIEIERMREALDRSSYSTAHRDRHSLPARCEGRDSAPLPVVTAIIIFTFHCIASRLASRVSSPRRAPAGNVCHGGPCYSSSGRALLSFVRFQ